jgi:hypothetical protein
MSGQSSDAHFIWVKHLHPIREMTIAREYPIIHSLRMGLEASYHHLIDGRLRLFEDGFSGLAVSVDMWAVQSL